MHQWNSRIEGQIDMLCLLAHVLGEAELCCLYLLGLGGSLNLSHCNHLQGARQGEPVGSGRLQHFADFMDLVQAETYLQHGEPSRRVPAWLMWLAEVASPAQSKGSHITQTCAADLMHQLAGTQCTIAHLAGCGCRHAGTLWATCWLVCIKAAANAPGSFSSLAQALLLNC